VAENDLGIRFRHSTFKFHPTNGTLMMLAQNGPLPFPYCDVTDPNSMFPSDFSWATIGDLNFVTTPGESFPSFGAVAKQMLAEDQFNRFGNIIVLGLTQDWMGYLLTQSQWSFDDLDYNKSLSPGPEVEPTYMAALKYLVAHEKK